MDDGFTAIAFRYDKTRVFFPAGYIEMDWDQVKTLEDLGAPVAKNGPEELWAADTTLVSNNRRLFDLARNGEEWQLEISPTLRMRVIVKEPVVAEVVGNGVAGFLAEVPPADQSTFSACVQQYFLIHRPGKSPGHRPQEEMRQIGELKDWKATPEVRLQIEYLLNARMKTELAGLHHYTYMDESADDQYPELNARFKMWRRFDRALIAEEAKLDYDIQAFQVTPDGVPRLFIRARWRVDQKPAFLMSAWLRTQPAPVIEAVDSGPSNTLRIIDGSSADIESLGTILNVFDYSGDGYGELLILNQLYEGFGIGLLRYTDSGPVNTGVSFGGSA